VIDAKGKSITPQEDWWRVCVKPQLHAQSLRRPIVMLKNGNYSAFRRNFPRKPVPDFLQKHLRPGKRFAGDLADVFGREMEFADSREQVGLQIVDALTNCVRRALSGRLQREGWAKIRNLMIGHRDGSLRIISLVDGDSIRNRPYYSVALELSEGRRRMLLPRAARLVARATRAE